MNILVKILLWLQGEMKTPLRYGWFHLMWIFFVIIAFVILYKLKNKYSEKQLKLVLGIYSIIALVLEILKQVIWSLDYNIVSNTITFDYQWYAFPFQLCTTPIIVCLICLFLKKTKLRTALLSYLSYITILGSIATVILPDSCFTSTTLVNIHTMWLHFGSLVVSIYLLMTKEVEIKLDNLIHSFYVFFIFLTIAETLNLFVYNSGILNGEVFDMFYVSPYFISTLPIFDVVQENVPFLIFFVFYISVILLGGFLIYYVSLGLSKLSLKNIIKKKKPMVS